MGEIYLLILFTLISSAYWGCVKSNKNHEKDYKFVAGTWMNEEYDSLHYSVKCEFYPDRRFTAYAKLSHIEKNIFREGVYEIVEKPKW